MGRDVLAKDSVLPIAATTHVFAGAIAAISVAGYAVPGSADATLKVMGRYEEEGDNTAGTVGGEVKCQVARGTFKFANSGTTDAITVADLYRDCYVVDDQTVARTSAAGTRPVAGKVVQVDTDGVWVELGAIAGNGTPIDIYVLAAADLRTSQYLGVKIDSNGAAALAVLGEFACGVLQNTPNTGAVAIVRVSGISSIIASGAVAIGSPVALTAQSTSKVAVAATVNTSDAGGAADPVIGSHVLGIALTLGATGTAHKILITHSGAVPTTAA
jgi:hypothetical protein